MQKYSRNHVCFLSKKQDFANLKNNSPFILACHSDGYRILVWKGQRDDLVSKVLVT